MVVENRYYRIVGLSLLLFWASIQWSIAQTVSVVKLGNTVDDLGWYKVGILNIEQQGVDAVIRIAAGDGYNAGIWQNGECVIHFRTSNTVSNNNGFYGAGTFYTTGRGKIVSAVKVNQLALNQFEIYLNLPKYTGEGGIIAIESYAGSWQRLFTYMPATPPGFDLPEELFVGSPVNLTGSLQVLANGSVGIGTTDPQSYKLAVNGPAIFTKAVVKNYTNWPDYVFDSTYQLAPLSSVEQYIQQYKHLPDVPSADSVHSSGIDLGGNQAVLLKKTEELTLYIIEQEKQLKIQQTKMAQQEEMIQLLKKEMDVLKKRLP